MPANDFAVTQINQCEVLSRHQNPAGQKVLGVRPFRALKVRPAKLNAMPPLDIGYSAKVPSALTIFASAPKARTSASTVFAALVVTATSSPLTTIAVPN